ncbi:vesicle-associated membrane protein 714 isoform X2 [Bubalus bubalis]|uniref:vesicle-associated membrane protein 714 isoform X2 n=1 Tax=Bubalus bubalis TaxID=89462 RepID=UPI000DBC7D8C|nr:vesicle-associated membrane protein 714 isoform X2 [Bubalus bubalis]
MWREFSFISSPTMTITYSCIANGRAVLAELALTGGSYQEAAAAVLKLVLLRAEPKTMIQMGSFVYHTLFIDGITYLCASDNALDILTPSAFLKNVSETFLKNPLMSQEHFSPSNAVAADFQQVLGKYMAKESPQTMKILRRIWRKHCKKIIIISMAILLSIIIILLSTNVIPT